MPDATGSWRRSGEEISFTVACHLTFDQHEARWFASYFSESESDQVLQMEPTQVGWLSATFPIQSYYILETTTTKWEGRGEDTFVGVQADDRSLRPMT